MVLFLRGEVWGSRLLGADPPRELSLPEGCLAQWLMGGSKYKGGAAEGMVSV